VNRFGSTYSNGQLCASAEDTLIGTPTEDVKGGEETILVVEDDEVREVAVSLLNELGYRVVKARDAASALVIARPWKMRFKIVNARAQSSGPAQSVRTIGGVALSNWEMAVTTCAGANGLFNRMLLGTPCEGH
jgi:hypothetical protein